jgi:predicted Zn-dependent peptidase
VTIIRGLYSQNKDSSGVTCSLYQYVSYLEILLKQQHIAQRLNATTKESLNALLGTMLQTDDSERSN